MRLDEAQGALEALKKADEALRAEVEPLRTWTQQVVEVHAKQQADVERFRLEAAGAAASGARITELEATVAKLNAELEAARKGGGAVSDDVEVLLSRARHLASLVQALEPFMWGLTQATHFYTKAKVDGGEEHMRVLQQLQGVLLRLRDEIAMLDLG